MFKYDIVIWKRGNRRVVISNGIYRGEQKIFFFWVPWFYVGDFTYKSCTSTNRNHIFAFFKKIDYMRK